jgi:tRNA(Arg) A34 adenosine deaminase TadA
MDNVRTLIRRTVELAKESIRNGGGPFGALIVKDGLIISEACNSVIPLNDPTAHAEILAIRKASASLGSHDLRGCILFTSCEPCPMCLGAVYWSGIRTVYYSSDRDAAARAGFADANIYAELLLKPAERTVAFFQIDDPEAAEVFQNWSQLDNKTPY